MADGSTGGKDNLRCPNCGALTVTWPRRGRKRTLLSGTYRRRRECTACGHVFEPQLSTPAACAVLLLGMVSLGLGVLGLVAKEVVWGELSHVKYLPALFSLGAVLGGLELLKDGVGALRRCRRA